MIILDASAAIEITRRTKVGLAFQSFILDGEEIITSDLFRAEVRNVFWKYVEAGFLDLKTARAYLGNTLSLADTFVPLGENSDEAFAEACRQNHSVYDMYYLTLVRRTAGTLMTSDLKLMKICKEMQLDCIDIVDI